MTHRLSIRAALTLLLLGGLFVWAQMELARPSLPARPTGTPDEITQFERRLAPVKAALPPRGVVGWTSDVPQQKRQATFILSMYALTPLVVVDSTDPEMIVGVFERPGGIEAFARAAGATVVRDFGMGVALFRKGRP